VKKRRVRAHTFRETAEPIWYLSPESFGREGTMSGRTSRRNFVAGGLAAAGGTLAAAALPMTGSSGLAFAETPEATAAPLPKTPDEAEKRLLAGNKRFVQGKVQNPRRDSVRRTETAEGQKPFAIILTCSDSRLAPEVIFDEGLGDLFIVRVAGNTGSSDPLLIGSMEYSVVTFGSVLLMVLGHSECGAVNAAVDVVTKGTTFPGELPAVVQPIVPAVEAVQSQPADQIVDAAIRQNVTLTQQGLGQISTFADAVQSGKLKIVGYEYQLHSGKVTPV
jgi:carbonic anhydrase